MRKSLLIISLLLLLPFVSSYCLTQPEIDAINQSAINTGVSPDIMINIYERLCNGNVVGINGVIQTYNATLQDNLNSINQSINNQVTNQMNNLTNSILSQVNNSAMATALNSIAYMYNQTITYNNVTELQRYCSDLVIGAKGEMASRFDNQSASLLNQFNTFKDETNQLLIDKNSNNLTTNRIIMIIFGVIVLGGAIYYFSRKKVEAYPNINRLPFDTRQTAGGLSDEEFSSSRKNKRMSEK